MRLRLISQFASGRKRITIITPGQCLRGMRVGNNAKGFMRFLEVLVYLESEMRLGGIDFAC